ncbi:MAG: D-cysteine desulfhydrase family protein [Deltaproteobacteria bacterium]|nr:D-cysteine desulfhydrase family protein [Deltaproteobacteria bacterium]
MHGPTPLVRLPRLAARFGLDLWIKRDDASGGVEAGNKVRKLEFLLGEARARQADTVITCGGIQSNHARATAVLAAQLGMKSVLVLRADDVHAALPISGNVLIDRMVGASIRLIDNEQWRDRNGIMAQEASAIDRAGGRSYVIPEGGSNGLGTLGYVEAMAEVRAQLDLGLGGGRPFDAIVHACGSGGTAAGIALGAAAYDVAPVVHPMAVCNDAAYFQAVIASIIAEARSIVPALPAPAGVVVDDASKGPAYAVSSDEQRAFIVEMARLCGLVLDPVYTGKGLHGLAQWVRRDGSLVGKRVLFVHTGGLPGLLAQGEEFERNL